MRSITDIIKIVVISLVGLISLGLIGVFSWNCYKDSASVKKLINDISLDTIKTAKISIYDVQGELVEDVPLSANWEKVNSQIIDKIDDKWDSNFIIKRYNLKKAIKGEGTSLTLMVFNLFCSDTEDSNIKYKACKRLQKLFSEEELAEIVYNRLYFGNSYFGFADASAGYFNKTPEELTDYELSVLLDFAQNKSYTEYELIDDTLINGATVLKQTTSNTIKDFTLKSLDGFNGQSYEQIVSNGVIVNTTLDSDIQKKVDSVLTGSKRDASLLVIDNEYGKIVAVAGDAFTRHEPGLIIKPNLVWGPALCGQYTINSEVTDEKIEGAPENYNKKYHGVISLSDAVAYSSNIVAWNIFTQLTSEKCFSYLDKMHFTGYDSKSTSRYASIGNITPGTSLMDLGNMYFTIFNGGIYSSINCIDSLGKPVESTGEIIYDYETAAELTYAMEQAVEKGICKNYALSREMPSAAYYDKSKGLYCGFSPYYTVVVYDKKNSGKIFKEVQNILCDGKAVITLTESTETALSESRDYSDLIAEIDAEFAKILKEDNSSNNDSTESGKSQQIDQGDEWAEDYDYQKTIDDTNANFGAGTGGSFNGESSDNNQIEFFK